MTKLPKPKPKRSDLRRREPRAALAEESVPPEGMPKFGTEIRTLRKQRGMTLAELAKACGLSVSFLSQVERDASNLSVAALYKIGKALGVNLTWFFHAGDGDLMGERHYVVRADRRRQLRYGTGMLDQLLVPHLNGALALFVIEFPPGAFSGDAKIAPNSEHAGLVLEGEFELMLNGKRFLLKAGDSFGFPGSLQHRYGNPGRRKTVVVWTHTPPTY